MSNTSNRGANSRAYRRHAADKPTPSTDAQREDISYNASSGTSAGWESDRNSTTHGSATDARSPDTREVFKREPADTLPALLQRLHQLMEEQDSHDQMTHQLQSRIREGQLACGRMMTEIVELQDALRLRTTHVQADKDKLSTEQEARAQKRQDIAECMAQLGALTGDPLKTD